MANQSSAYDLSMFEPRRKEVAEPQAKPRLRKLPATKKQAKRVVSPISLTLCGLLVVGMLVVHVANNAAMTESKAQLEYQQAQLAKAISADELMDVELERLLSISNLDEYARDELGLSKPETYQIAYLPDDNDGTIQIHQAPSDNLFTKFSSFFQQMVGRLS